MIRFGIFRMFVICGVFVLALSIGVGSMRGFSRACHVKVKAQDQASVAVAEAKEAEDDSDVGVLQHLDVVVHVQVGWMPVNWLSPLETSFESSASLIPVAPTEYIFITLLNLPPPASC